LAVKRQVAGSELLVSKESTIFASVEDKVGHESAGTIIHKDALELDVSQGIQELNVPTVRENNVPVEHWRFHHQFAY
jgi:hypothetical protein